MEREAKGQEEPRSSGPLRMLLTPEVVLSAARECAEQERERERERAGIELAACV